MVTEGWFARSQGNTVAIWPGSNEWDVLLCSQPGFRLFGKKKSKNVLSKQETYFIGNHLNRNNNCRHGKCETNNFRWTGDVRAWPQIVSLKKLLFAGMC